MALPQNLPRDADNTFVSETWAEAGVVVEPSAGRKATGWTPGDTVTQPEMNWQGREPARYARANQSQFLRASSKLVSSWLDTGAGATGFGTWSDTGVGALEGFLSDAAGIDTRAVDVWLDPAGDGATGLQVKVAIGTPATFAATRDNYVFVPIDTLTGGLAVWADITLLAVAVGAPAPATPAGTIGVWVVETDGASIVGQTILVPTIPAFKTIGFEALNTIGTVMIGGDLDVAGSLDVGVDLDVVGETTVRMFTVADDAPSSFTGNVTLGTDAGDAIISNGITNFNATTTFNAAANFVATTTTNGSLVANGDVSLGDNDGDTIEIGGGATDVVNLNADLLGSISTTVETGTVELLVGAPSPTAGQLAVGSTGALAFHDGSSGKFVHYSDAGFVYATGDQQAATGLLAAHLVAQTSGSATAQGGQVRVIIYGELQVSSLGSTFTLAAQEDQGGFTDIAPNKIVTALVDGSDVNDWQPFRHERVFAPLTTATFYRLSATAQGGRTINLREVRLRVVKERY